MAPLLSIDSIGSRNTIEVVVATVTPGAATGRTSVKHDQRQFHADQIFGQEQQMDGEPRKSACEAPYDLRSRTSHS